MRQCHENVPWSKTTHFYKYRSDSTPKDGENDVSTTETEFIRSHLSDPHARWRQGKGLIGKEGERPSIAVVPARTLAVYKRIGGTGSMTEGKQSRSCQSWSARAKKIRCTDLRNIHEGCLRTLRRDL